MDRWRCATLQHDRGASAVEFALILPLLLLVVFGIFEFGRAYNAQITLQHAVREGVRYHAIYDDAPGAKDRTVEAATSIDLDPDDVIVGDCDAGDPTSVSANYGFSFLVWDFGPDFTMSAEGSMRCGG